MSQNKNQKPKKQFEDFTRYSSLAFEMIVIMGVGVWVGIKIDGWLSMSFPVFTFILMILSVFGAIYYAVRRFL